MVPHEVGAVLIPYVAAGALVVAAPGLGRVLAWIGGRSREPARPGTAGSGIAPASARLGAALTALFLLVGGAGGDVVLAGVLAGVAVARRSPAAAFVVVSVALSSTLRAGSSLAADVEGTHAVLGPALTSPEPGVAVPAALALAAAAGAAAALVPPRLRRSGLAALRTPDHLLATLGPVLVVLLAVGVATGAPAAASGSGLAAPSARVMLAIVLVLVATFLRRAVGPATATLTTGAAILAAVGFVIALAAS